MKFRLAMVTVPMAVALSLPAVAADWLQFRSSDAVSHAPRAEPPVEIGDEQIAWAVELPGKGPASPIVVGDRVIVTASSRVQQDRMHVLCFAADSGEQLWERQFWATGRTASHESSGNAAPTPASDGEAIYAFFSSNDLVCLELDGTLRWFRGLAHDFPKAGNDIGMASSPVVIDGVVVVQVENQGDSFAMGIDAATGETRWRDERAHQANWATPLPLRDQGIVILQSPGVLSAHRVQTGEALWRFEGTGYDTVSSSCVVGDRLFVPTNNGVACLEYSDTQPDRLWTSRLRPGAASAVHAENQLYAINRAGVLTAADATNGATLWQLRLSGAFWATPAIAGQVMYAVNQEGTLHVIELGAGEGRLISEYDLGEIVQASPAISGDAVYVRSDQHLRKIAHSR